MADSINVRGLTDEQVEALKKLIKLFREQKKPEALKRSEKEVVPEDAEGKLTLSSRRSKVIGKLTREEIYEER